MTAKNFFMKNKIRKTDYHKILIKHAWILFTVIIVSYFVLLHFFTLAGLSQISGDTVSRALPAIGPLRGLGFPYKDYWEIAPPGMYLINFLWMALFGTDIAAFKALHAVLILVSTFGITRIFYKIFPKPLFAALSIFTIIIFLSPRITQFLPIELFALTFAIIGVNILISENWTFKRRAILGVFFIIFSGQIKEPFAPIILVAIPFLWFVFLKKRKDFWKTFKAAIIGMLLALAVVFLPVILSNATSQYKEVLDYKSTGLHLDSDLYTKLTTFTKGLEFPKLTFIYLDYSIVTFIIISLIIYLLLKISNKGIRFQASGANRESAFLFKVSLSEKLNAILITLFYSIGSWLGTSLQNKYSGHYDIGMVFPIIYLISIFSYLVFSNFQKLIEQKIKNKKIYGFTYALFTLAILISVFPKKAYFVEYPYSTFKPQRLVRTLLVSEKLHLNLENTIRLNTKKDDCILRVYGWDVGTTYFYSSRKPCARFFLVNILPDYFGSEYRAAIISNPPAAIVYNLGGADLNIIDFEKNTFNYTGVLNYCYVQDATVKDLYWPKIKDPKVTGDCIKSVLLQSRQI